MTRAVGPARARELMFTGERVDAAHGERIGLFNRVVPDAQLMEASLALARSLAQGPPLALAAIKDNLDEAGGIDFATARDREAERMVRCSTTADHKEAVRAFVEKRKPHFTGA
jgi:enoyl-CoA hydratase/carnithine racemase